MTEQEILQALNGKFFRGPKSFYTDRPGINIEEIEEEEEVLEKIDPADPEAEIKWKVPVNICIKAVCVAHKITTVELLDTDSPGSRRPHLVRARQHAVWLIKKLRPEISYPQIAGLLNYKDHTTVIHGIRRFETIKTRFTPEVNSAIEYLRQQTGDHTICSATE